jgi:peptidoglycan/xylan/chitin deacetylase (PgdA/CDA1 family)
MSSLYLLYHELRPTPSRYSYVVECSEFESHCALFAQLQAHPGTGLRPEITFDDGDRSNHDFALPILERHGLRAHFFITAGWTGEREGYMGWPELRALHAAGHSIGAHGMTHALLTHCSASELDRELREARLRLEDGLSAPITTMSLPGGRSNARVLDACWNAGYRTVFTSAPHASPAPLSDRATPGRVNVDGATNSDRLRNLLQPNTGALAALERRDRVKSAAKSLLGDNLYAKLWSVVNRQEPERDATEAGH